MKSIDEILPFLSLLIEGMAKHFGESCEFVVHDYSKGTSSCIVAIANGDITGRTVGKGSQRTSLRMIPGKEEESGEYNSVSQTQDGRFLRSSTIYLRGDDGAILGALCINLDVSEMIRFRNFIERYIYAGLTDVQRRELGESELSSVDDFLLSMIVDSIKYVGVPVAHMTREQKVEGVNYLNRRGAFKIKNAAAIAAKYYDISRYTLYNYLSDSDE